MQQANHHSSALRTRPLKENVPRTSIKEEARTCVRRM